jgi:hypothetical protein
MLKVNPRDKTKVHRVVQPIRYHGKGEHAGALVMPGDAELSFDHLSDAGYLLLRQKGVIVPVEAGKRAPAGGANGGE